MARKSLKSRLYSENVIREVIEPADYESFFKIVCKVP